MLNASPSPSDIEREYSLDSVAKGLGLPEKLALNLKKITAEQR